MAGEVEREAERLLELHDELDRLVTTSQLESPLWIVVWIVGLAMMIQVFFIAAELGLGLEFGLVLGLGIVGVTVPYALQRRRVREIRDRIDQIEHRLGPGDSP